MTSRVYRTAQGKIVDMGSITLQNEMVRAVGNMNVNARGDRLDGANKVIDSRNRQVQRQVQRQSNMSDAPVHTSTVTAKQSKVDEPVEEILFNEPAMENNVGVAVTEIAVAAAPAPVDLTIDQSAIPAGGLAAALAKAKTVTQSLDQTPRERAQAQGVRKL